MPISLVGWPLDLLVGKFPSTSHSHLECGFDIILRLNKTVHASDIPTQNAFYDIGVTGVMIFIHNCNSQSAQKQI